MPHAENTSEMSAPTVNGVKDKSAFISHLLAYPVISDSLATLESTPLGQKSLSLTHQTITRLQPLFAQLSGPYAKLTPYLTPYLSKADSLGDSALNTLDVKVPAVRKPTGELYDNGKVLAFLPLRKGIEGKEYVLGTFNSEVKKVGGDGLVAYGKAALTTSLIVSSDVFAWAASLAAKKKAEAKEVMKEKTDQQ